MLEQLKGILGARYGIQKCEINNSGALCSNPSDLNVYYRFAVEEVFRTADFLDKYAEHTESSDLEQDLIGVYFNYKLNQEIA